MMKEKTDFWLNLFLSAILPSVLGSGSIYLLVQFKEGLPGWLYTTFLFVIYAVLVAVLIRLAFGDWFRKLTIWVRNGRRGRAQRKVASNLFAKWVGLSNQLAGRGYQPTKEQEDKYSELHLWFIRNRQNFLPLWYNFRRTRTDTAHDSHYHNSTVDLGYKVLVTNSEDPFSYFYEPPIVRILCDTLERERPGVVRLILAKLDELTVEFVQWARLR